MTCLDAVARLTRDADRIRGLGVRHLYLFGSTVRGEAGPASDVDLFVEQEGDGFGILELLSLRDELCVILGAAADVATRDSLHPVFRDQIEAEAVAIF